MKITAYGQWLFPHITSTNVSIMPPNTKSYAEMAFVPIFTSIELWREKQTIEKAKRITTDTTP